MRLHLAERSSGGELSESVGGSRGSRELCGDAPRAREFAGSREEPRGSPHPAREFARDVRGRRQDARRGDARQRRVSSRHRVESRVPLRRGLPEQGGGERRHRAGYLLREGLRDAARDPRRGDGRRFGSRRRSRRDATDHRESARSRRDRRRRWRGDINLAPRPRLELCESGSGLAAGRPRSGSVRRMRAGGIRGPRRVRSRSSPVVSREGVPDLRRSRVAETGIPEKTQKPRTVGF